MWWGVIKESLQKHLEIKGRQRQKLFEGKEGIQGCHPLPPSPFFFVFINFLFSNAIITKHKLEIHIWKNITLLNIYTS